MATVYIKLEIVTNVDPAKKNEPTRAEVMDALYKFVAMNDLGDLDFKFEVVEKDK